MQHHCDNQRYNSQQKEHSNWLDDGVSRPNYIVQAQDSIEVVSGFG